MRRQQMPANPREEPSNAQAFHTRQTRHLSRPPRQPRMRRQRLAVGVSPWETSRGELSRECGDSKCRRTHAKGHPTHRRFTLANTPLEPASSTAANAATTLSRGRQPTGNETAIPSSAESAQMEAAVVPKGRVRPGPSNPSLSRECLHKTIITSRLLSLKNPGRLWHAVCSIGYRSLPSFLRSSREFRNNLMERGRRNNEHQQDHQRGRDRSRPGRGPGCREVDATASRRQPGSDGSRHPQRADGRRAVLTLFRGLGRSRSGRGQHQHRNRGEASLPAASPGRPKGDDSSRTPSTSSTASSGANCRRVEVKSASLWARGS